MQRPDIYSLDHTKLLKFLCSLLFSLFAIPLNTKLLNLKGSSIVLPQSEEEEAIMGNTASDEGYPSKAPGHEDDGDNVHEISLSCPFYAKTIDTKPIEGQKPGTSGLRKPTKIFMETPNYLENFIASTLTCVLEGAGGGDHTEPVHFPTSGKALLIGGDGRYYNDTAVQTIIRIGVAMGISRFWIGKDGLLSTPAISAIIRERGPQWQAPFGSFILTASHNPGGPDADFGIKYNCGNGGPAPEGLTDAIYEGTTTIQSYSMAVNMPEIKLDEVGTTIIWNESMTRKVSIEVIGKCRPSTIILNGDIGIHYVFTVRMLVLTFCLVHCFTFLDTTETHVTLLKSIFDFDGIKKMLDRDDFSFVYDAMSGVNGPYAKAVFCDELGQDESVLMNCEPKDDFGGGHADPNLTYAKELVAKMGLDANGNTIEVEDPTSIPSFGAAADGDGDRNMILGTQFFVTPSDSLAVLAAQCTKCIPFFAEQGGLKAVARSMPTSGAVDLVAKEQGFDLFETPTGWKVCCYYCRECTPFSRAPFHICHSRMLSYVTCRSNPPLVFW
jgi:phosphoglucomutase